MKHTMMLFLLCFFLVMACLNTPVFAEDADNSMQESTTISSEAEIETEQPFGGAFADFSTNTNGFGSGFDADILDNWDSILNGDSVGIWNQIGFSLPTPVESVNALNFQFSSLQSEMALYNYGEDFTLSIPEFNPGYSQNIQERFATTFGDLSGKMTLSPSLPDGFDMQHIMASAQAMRQSENNSFQSSSLYNNVIANISFGDVVESFVSDQYKTSFVDGLSDALEEHASFMRQEAEAEQRKNENTTKRNSGFMDLITPGHWDNWNALNMYSGNYWANNNNTPGIPESMQASQSKTSVESLIADLHQLKELSEKAVDLQTLTHGKSKVDHAMENMYQNDDGTLDAIIKASIGYMDATGDPTYNNWRSESVLAQQKGEGYWPYSCASWWATANLQGIQTAARDPNSPGHDYALDIVNALDDYGIKTPETVEEINAVYGK